MARGYNIRKRVMVTARAGFLGSHLIDRLLEQGHEVLCIDNLFTGAKQNLDHLRGHERLPVLRHDPDLRLAGAGTMPGAERRPAGATVRSRRRDGGGPPRQRPAWRAA